MRGLPGLPTEVNMGYTGGGPSPLCGVLRVPRAGLQEDEAAAGRTKRVVVDSDAVIRSYVYMV